MMKLGKKGLDLIKEFEGLRLKAYKAVSTEKYYTIGYGHYGADVSKDMQITKEQAEKMLIVDLEKFESYVRSSRYVPLNKELNQHQFDALVSFCYNLGQANLKKLCYGYTLKQISERIPLFNKAGGQVLNGLVRRRNEEKKLFDTYTESSPASQFKQSYAKKFITTSNLNLRKSAGVKHQILVTIPKGTVVSCSGCYTTVDKTEWLQVTYNGTTGFCSKSYLK